MSVRVSSQVWGLDLPQNLKLLALALADWADDDGGGIHPSNHYVAWKVGVSERNVRRQMAKLVELGFVEVEAVHGFQLASGQWVKRLRLHPDRVPVLAPFRTPVTTSEPQEASVSEGPDNLSALGVQPAPSLPDPDRPDASALPAAQRPGDGVPPRPGAAAPQYVRDTLGEEIRKVSSPSAKRNFVWEGFSAVFGEPTGPAARKRRGKNVAEVAASLAASAAAPSVESWASVVEWPECADEVLRRAQAWPLHFEGATLTEEALAKHWDTLGRSPLRVGAAQVAAHSLEQARADRAARLAALDRGLPS